MFLNLRVFYYDANSDLEDSGGMTDDFVSTADAAGAQNQVDLTGTTVSHGGLFGTIIDDLEHGSKSGNPIKKFLDGMMPTVKTNNSIDSKSIFMLIGGLVLVVFVYIGFSKKH